MAFDWSNSAFEPKRILSLNAVSPQPVSNADFTRAVAHALGRPAFLRVPAFALRLGVNIVIYYLTH